mmetsp:Transcript_11087/g.28409  ORF Transcript_11087/g.28409 Transcript_11087/m.28409 type:complete len:598 (-) Transcript_11087:10-1803(-)
MLNANTGGGLDPSNARAYANAQYAQGQGGQGGNGAFNLGGNMLHSMQGNYGVQGGMPGGRPGLGGIPTSASQQPQPQQVGGGQGRFPGGLGPGSMQQQMQRYGQVPGRSGMPMGMNGLGPGGGSGGVAPGGMPGGSRPGMDRGASAGLMGMGPAGGGGGGSGGLLGMRTGSGQVGGGGVNLASLGGPRGLPVSHLTGQLGSLSMQGSPARPGVPVGGPLGGGGGMPGMPGVGPAGGYGNPSGDLLAMMNKAQGQVGPGLPGMLGAKGGVDSHGGMPGFPGSLGPGDQGPEQPAFDASDFPSLGGGPGQPRVAPTPEQQFSMQTEDFPALPSSATSSFGGQRLGDDMSGLGAGFQQGAPSSSSGYEQMMWSQQQAAAAAQMGAGGPKPGGGKGGGPDRFGLLGLLSVIRMTEQDLTTLALGTDLTTLGLNLNSPDSLYKSFASPWADAPVRPEPEFSVPACYMHSPPRLQPGYFSKFQQDTLFYIFYSMPGDEAQLFAADELASRGWWFHKEHKLWLTRVPNTEPIMKTDRFERASYFVFDTNSWECVRRDNFGLQYDALERAPNLLRPGLPPAGMAGGGGNSGGGPSGMQPPPPAPK